jgi:hypothetical protein
VLAVLGSSACAASQHPDEDTDRELWPGDPDAAPSLAALPELPSGAAAETPRTHQGLLIARQAMGTRLPAPPADRSSVSLQRWIDTVVVEWVAGRREQTETARERFLLEGTPNAAEAIVSHAVLGLLQEDTALTLARLPTPSELDTEPEIADMFRDVTRKQADAFLNAAMIELRDCANAGYRAGGDMRPWAEFCHARFDRLYAELYPQTVRADQ